MDWKRWALVAVALLGGLFMPEFYDWSGEDQSRAAPVVRWIALSILILDAVVIGIQVWKHRSELRADIMSAPNWNRFSLLRLLIAMTLMTILAAANSLLKMPVSYGTLLIVVLFAVVLAIKQVELRWQIVTLLVCLWMPFLWVIRWPELHGNMLPMLIMLPGVPAILPMAWSSYLAGWNMAGDTALAAVYTTLELGTGLWMMHCGPRLALAYSLGILTLSLFSSFVLQALMRM